MRSDRTASHIVRFVAAATVALSAVPFGRADEPEGLELHLARPARVALQAPAAGGGELILADRATIRRLDQARRFLDSEQYPEAIALLQRVLDDDEDAFHQPEDRPGTSFHSVRAEATRLIGSIPPNQLRDTYQLEYGPAAERLLEEATEHSDPLAIGEVARRYLHTDAGQRALFLLGRWHADGGRPLAAAAAFRRLLELPAAALKYDPRLSLRTAIELARAGDAEAAEPWLERWAAHAAARPVTVGDATLDPQQKPRELLAEIGRRFASDTELVAARSSWPMPGGDPTRNALVRFEPDDLGEPWTVGTIVDPFRENPRETSATPLTKQFDNALRLVTGQLAASNPAAFPGWQPVVVGNRVAARTLGNLQLLELADGEIASETFAERSLEDLVGFEGEPDVARLRNALPNYVRQRVWQDATQGTFSSDGRVLYAVEDAGLATPWMQPEPRQIVAPARSNRLAAYDLETGRLLWQIGGPKGDFELPLAETFFLGPPLPLAGRLYCITESDNEIRLTVLEPRADAEPSLVWSQPLAAPNVDIEQDLARRTSGVTPCCAEGVVVCPTGTGNFVAVDVANRSLLWGRTFSENGAANPGPVPQPQPQPSGWPDETAIAVGTKVLLVTPWSDELHCVDLADGRDAWKESPERGDGLHVVGATSDRVIVAGSSEVNAFRLSDGKPAWKSPLTLGPPSGRGFLTAKHAWLPLGSGEIALVDLAAGRVASKLSVPEGVELGHIVPADGMLVTQSPRNVAAFSVTLPDAERAERR